MSRLQILSPRSARLDESQQLFGNRNRTTHRSQLSASILVARQFRLGPLLAIQLYGACQWGMLSVLAKLGNTSIVGQFTLGLAVAAPVFMFTNLQLRAVQATDVSLETGFANYFTLRLLATLFGLMVIIAVLSFAGASFAVRVVILLVAISKCVECMSDVTAGLLQREEQLKRVAISLMMRGIASVLVFSLTFAFFRNLALSVGAMSVVWLVVLLSCRRAERQGIDRPPWPILPLRPPRAPATGNAGPSRWAGSSFSRH